MLAPPQMLRRPGPRPGPSPADPIPPSRSTGPPGPGRIALHVLLAGMPLLAISAHVFGLVPMHLSAALLVIPLTTAVVVLTVFAPHPADRVVGHGLAWGVVACAVYDVFRLDTVLLLDLWGDFIPTMGTWITGRPGDLATGAVVGYLWRYVGDGGGIGITFFVLASAVGLHRYTRRTVVLAAVGFAVAPVWAGLVGTVALAPRGQQLMFPLTPTTVLLSLIGHLIFGLVLGLGFWHSKGVQAHWPWAPQAVPERVRAWAVRTPEPVPAPVMPVVPVQRTSSPAPGARTLDPATRAEWRRRLETTQPGRRVHGERRPV